jgi:hypothetical protein
MLGLIQVLILLLLFLLASIALLATRLYNVLQYVKRLKKVIRKLEGETFNDPKEEPEAVVMND